MGEKSELSMSVQSAWEDLIVENPNRRKLEACLVTTIMIVVVCIMGLLLFVVIELQPANNLQRVTRRPNVADCSNGTCTEFGHRVLGWINFHGKPCIDFHNWVCNGRMTDSPEEPFMQTAEKAGTYTANAEFHRLFMRNYQYELTKNNINKNAVTYIAKLYDVCMNGFEKVEGTPHALVTFLEKTLWNGAVKGMAGAAEVSAFQDYHVILMKTFNFHPFGRMLKESDKWVIMPMSLLGTAEQLELAGFGSEMMDAVTAFVTTYKKGTSDNATPLPKLEQSIGKAMQSKDPDADFPYNKVIQGYKENNLQLALLVEQVFGEPYTGKFSVRYATTGPALSVYDQGGATAMNLATFKFLLMLSLFADEDDPNLAKFFAFANKYYWGSKVLPVKVYRCGTFIENYLKPAMLHFISVYDKARLEAIKTETQTRLKEFTEASSPDKKAVSPFQATLKNAKSKLGDVAADFATVEFFYLNDTKKHSDNYFTCGSPLPDWDDAAEGGFLTHLNTLSEMFACNYKLPEFQKQHGLPVLGSEPFFDFVSGITYIPYGFSFPPNYHPFVRGISFHHYAPGFYFRIIGEVLKAGIWKNAGVAGAKGVWKAESAEVTQGHNCYRKEIKSKQNLTGAMQIFIDTMALPMAYQMYRSVLNHAAWDVKKQARVSLIPMFTEGQYFFIQAAQTRCDYLDPNPKIQYTQKASGATPVDKVNLVFAKSNALFANRFGCGKGRPMATLSTCKTPVLPLKKSTEKEHPGVFL